MDRVHLGLVSLILIVSRSLSDPCTGTHKGLLRKLILDLTGKPAESIGIDSCTITGKKITFRLQNNQSCRMLEIELDDKNQIISNVASFVNNVMDCENVNYVGQKGFSPCEKAKPTSPKTESNRENIQAAFIPAMQIKMADKKVPPNLVLEECYINKAIVLVLMTNPGVGTCYAQYTWVNEATISAKTGFEIKSQNCLKEAPKGGKGGVECEKNPNKLEVLQHAASTLMGDDNFIKTIISCKDDKESNPHKLFLQFKDYEAKTVTLEISYTSEEKIVSFKFSIEKYVEAYLKRHRENCSPDEKALIKELMPDKRVDFSLAEDFGIDQDIVYCAKDGVGGIEFGLKKGKIFCNGRYVGKSKALVYARFGCIKE